MARKELIYQGLDRINVDIEDTSATSPDYFKVTELKPQFNAGINAFKFKANLSLFSEGAYVYIEILDSNGDPVYNEAGLDLESKNQSIIISVYINQDVPPGPARITLCSTLNQSVNGNLLNTSRINLRWSTLIYIDPSLPNETEIVFNSLPVITVTATTASYNDYGYSGGRKIATAAVNATYNYSNNSPVLFTASNATIGFDSTSLSTTVQIAFTSMSLARPLPSGIVTVPTTGPQVYTSTITAFSGSGIAYLATPITFAIDNSKSRYQIANAAVTASITYEQPLPLVYSETENTHNVATVFFSNLAPQLGTIAKIRAYTRSTGINEYILLNDLDITYLELEPGFTVNSATASFVLPTSHRNDRLDLKFEFINPSGIVSKQSIEVLNTLFLGGNTYIGGDDNLLTGSLFVASSTGTGVQITGKNSSAMIASIGYQGFDTAKANNGGQYAGFVLYSGSIQSILGSSESYSGVGLELVANSASYFKYTTSGLGMLDIRTNSFFLGNTTGTFISGSNGNLQISASNFSIINGNVTASNILLENISYADFFANKQIVIDSSNANQFYRYIIPTEFAQAYCILDLSGVQGPFATGSAAMYVRFYVNPKLPIAAIISPADSGYDGQIIIETYGPAYTSPTYQLTCGAGTDFGENVLFKANYVTEGVLISNSNDYFYETASIATQNFPFPDYYWSGSGQVTSTYFSNTSSITPPIGLSVNTLGKKRSYRSRITFETDDWSSYSYNLSIANPAIAYSTCPTNYQSMLSCAPGGRYAFAPGDSGWRLQSVTNYGGSVTPWFANSLTVSKSLQAGTLGDAWTGVTFGTNWTNYGVGHQSVQYKKFGDQVYLRGLATSGINSWATYPTMSVLPAGYKPPARLIFAQVGNNSAFVRVDIDSNGTVLWTAGGTSPGYISLNGISFSTLS